MVDCCDKSGDFNYARSLFNQVIEPNVFLYNSTIRAYTHNHMYGLAITAYKQMLRHPILPDKFTFPYVLKSSAGLIWHSLGKQVHGHLRKFGPKAQEVTENALIDMYVKFNDLLDAQKVFDEMTDRDVISWNNLISGHVRLGQIRKAEALFDEMPFRTIVSWTTMISGYTRSGCHADALDTFRRMQRVGIEPDEISMVSVLPACAQLGALEVGKWIHMYCERNGSLRKTFICNALMEMYSKCGCINDAKQLFDQMSDRDVISWSTMIGGLGNHGRADEAIQLFQQMQRANVEPNGITFLGLFSACVHAGLCNEGLKYFDFMRKDYKIEPEVEHYGCLVDLLGRSGRLSQALDMIQNMPVKPDSKVWGSLLSSCRTHHNLEIAVIAMENLEVLEPEETGNYVLLSNIYADLGKWEGVSRMRQLIRAKSMKKTPGCSLIEVDSVVQEFVSGDNSKPFSKGIFDLLELLALHKDVTDDIMVDETGQNVCQKQ
ncbi:PPR domain-containing protein/PPR_2 domain-containing protein [Cephalotus follicularis]|uniref:PPR domain-containing protein/PPR_2 domain-containing protein n=1 Tax=Cephalotus follicularis TaxID=3775 RepID=A0A1Q3CDP8_CEPFO|nr:PPR domain-containing protein/PPR_2 domain-containing protein [Cephalotus follicularis]